MKNKMLQYGVIGLIIFILSVNSAFAQRSVGPELSRAALLYENHCKLCHSQQIHWRDKKIANNWESLIVQVDFWQHASGLDWTKADIKEVSRYLNAQFYHYQ
jgi:hypothetical protein